MKAKYKGRGGNRKLYKQELVRRQERKMNRIHKVNEPEPKKGYIFTYKATITDRLHTFADLHKIKLVDTISIYSDNNNRAEIDRILANRKNWPYDNEIHYIDYNFESVVECPTNLIPIRKTTFWGLEIRDNKLVIKPSLLGPNGEFQTQVYMCYTTLNYLLFLNKKYNTKGLLFSNGTIEGNQMKKVYKLTNINGINALLRKGKVLVTEPNMMDRLLKIRAKKGWGVEYIYDQQLIPKFETKKRHKRKQIYTEPRLLFEHDPEKQKLVCITDGITYNRIKKYEADKIIAKHPGIKFCTKAEYQAYLDKSYHQFLPKEKWDSIKTLSVQGDKRNPKDTRTRKERRYSTNKHKHYSRFYKSQFIRANEKWIPDEDGEHENLVEYPAKTITVRTSRPKYTPKYVPNQYANARKKRLFDAYVKYFADVERRNSKFSQVEAWSTQFMELLKMVKQNKPEKEIALKISKIFTGWNDKKIKRFIKYLRLTKHGLAYKPNHKTQPVKLYDKVEKESNGIKIAKFPYHMPMTIEYKKVDADDNETLHIEQNVYVQQKKVVKEDTETKEIAVICSIKDIVRWVEQDKYSDKEDCPWKPLITITKIKKNVVVKLPYHLPKKKEKTSKWKCPIKISRWRQHGEVIERKWLKKDVVGIRKYIVQTIKHMKPENIKQFALFIGDTQFRNIVDDAMFIYSDKKYNNTPMQNFLLDILPF